MQGDQDEKENLRERARAIPADPNLLERTAIARLYLEGKTDWELIGMTPVGGQYRAPMEMSRRLMDAIGLLRHDLSALKASSDKWARKLFWLTVALMVLTVCLVVLSCALLARSPAAAEHLFHDVRRDRADNTSSHRGRIP